MMDSTWSEDELNFDNVLCDGDDEDPEDDEDEEEIERPDPSTFGAYRKKYLLLLERCRAIQQDNELLVSRVTEVRRLERRSRRERRMLIKRLDSHGDNFRNVPIVLPQSDDILGSGKKGKAAEKKLKKLEEAGRRDGLPGRGRKRNKDKPPRDPNLPKRPQNPFFQYCKEKRDTVAQDVFKNQGINLTKKELTRILANQWNSLDATAKQVCDQLIF